MRWVAVVPVLIVQLLCGIAPAGLTSASDCVSQCWNAELADEPVVRQTCWRLLARARFGFSRGEQAAFIVRGESGRISAVEWPSKGEPDSALWVGAFPAGTVAIVHTHPNWLGTPSRIDAHTARSTHLPVYVITRTRICKTDGASTHIVVDGDWQPRS
jgi:hypothetical protein